MINESENASAEVVTYTRQDLMSLLNVSSTTLHRIMKKHPDFPKCVVKGRYPKAAIDNFLKQKGML